MDQKLKIGLSLLAIGIAALSATFIALAGRTFSAGTAGLLGILMAFGFIAFFSGVYISLTASGPVSRGVFSIVVGILFYPIVLLGVYSNIVWPDIALALSFMGLAFLTSAFIVPGAVTIVYHRFSAGWAIACVLIAMTMLWTLILSTAVPYALKVSDFRAYFYAGLVPNLLIGFFAGLISTGFVFARVRY
jgi:hypothetical protein